MTAAPSHFWPQNCSSGSFREFADSFEDSRLEFSVSIRASVGLNLAGGGEQ